MIQSSFFNLKTKNNKFFWTQYFSFKKYFILYFFFIDRFFSPSISRWKKVFLFHIFLKTSKVENFYCWSSQNHFLDLNNLRLEELQISFSPLIWSSFIFKFVFYQNFQAFNNFPIWIFQTSKLIFSKF